jgi:hypothetical protein
LDLSSGHLLYIGVRFSMKILPHLLE